MTTQKQQPPQDESDEPMTVDEHLADAEELLDEVRKAMGESSWSEDEDYETWVERMQKHSTDGDRLLLAQAPALLDAAGTKLEEMCDIVRQLQDMNDARMLELQIASYQNELNDTQFKGSGRDATEAALRGAQRMLAELQAQAQAEQPETK